MNKTRVDDMLIEMIEPKIREINTKFTNGESLTQDDINTLLLKSQYNHINHLDDKLNETVDSVKNLEYAFKDLKNGFIHLEEKMDEKYQHLEERFNEKLDVNNKELNEKMDFNNDLLNDKIDTVNKSLNEKIESLDKKIDSKIDALSKNIDKKFEENNKIILEQMKSQIQQALNKNMMMFIIVIGFFMTLSKLIDKF